MSQDFRVKFVTQDGSIIMDRKGQADFYFLPNGDPDKTFVDSILKTDAREKGVRVISYQLNNQTGLIAVVDWL